MKIPKYVILCNLLVFIIGCSPAAPFRTKLAAAGSVDCPMIKAAQLKECSAISPETSWNSYDLHFVEYDDQGWAYTIPSDTQSERFARNITQTDHLMDSLNEILGKKNQSVSIILYVHGWKHNADALDPDVAMFRKILDSAARRAANEGFPNRKIVGIYVGWRGKSLEVPPALLNISFWARKDAANRVSQGAVQELFARLRTVQRYYNNLDRASCFKSVGGTLTTGGCRVRTLMIGHSFGAYILYSAIEGPLMATLNAERDLRNAPRHPGITADLPGPNYDLYNDNLRPADMVVLINPAFEAVRYQPLHQAAVNYKSITVQAPLLVTITSTADAATKTLFPIGRSLNSIFERLTATEEEVVALSHTHGHIEFYQTHVLSDSNEVCKTWKDPEKIDISDNLAIKANHEIEMDNSDAFREENSVIIDNSILLRPNWVRYFCGGTKLTLLPITDPRQNRDPNSLVWNIRTGKSVISSHSDISNWRLINFVRQLYDDTDLNLPHNFSRSQRSGSR